MTHDELRELIARAFALHFRSENKNRNEDTVNEATKLFLDACDAILAALSTAGLAIVPVEATELLAWADQRLGDYRRIKGQNEDYCDRRDAIRAMLAASPFTKETGR